VRSLDGVLLGDGSDIVRSLQDIVLTGAED